MEHSVENKAKAFAFEYHKNQKRKYTKEPYIVHPAEVANLVRSVSQSEEMIAAAWLHDVVEDTEATIEQIEEEFGAQIASLVEMLTDVSRLEDGNRNVRKELDRQHLAKASPEAKTIKLADLISNTTSIIIHDPDFSRVYLKEKFRLLNVLTEGDQTLYTRSIKLLITSQVALDNLRDAR